jgi:hypothetical protein
MQSKCVLDDAEWTTENGHHVSVFNTENSLSQLGETLHTHHLPVLSCLMTSLQVIRQYHLRNGNYFLLMIRENIGQGAVEWALFSY